MIKRTKMRPITLRVPFKRPFIVKLLHFSLVCFVHAIRVCFLRCYSTTVVIVVVVLLCVFFFHFRSLTAFLLSCAYHERAHKYSQTFDSQGITRKTRLEESFCSMKQNKETKLKANGYTEPCWILSVCATAKTNIKVSKKKKRRRKKKVKMINSWNGA